MVFLKFQGPCNTNESVGDISSPPVIPGAGGVVPVCEVPHPPPGLPMPQYNMADYVVGQHPWPTNILVSPINQGLEVLYYILISMLSLYISY